MRFLYSIPSLLAKGAGIAAVAYGVYEHTPEAVAIGVVSYLTGVSLKPVDDSWMREENGQLERSVEKRDLGSFDE